MKKKKQWSAAERQRATPSLFLLLTIPPFPKTEFLKQARDSQVFQTGLEFIFISTFSTFTTTISTLKLQLFKLIVLLFFVKADLQTPFTSEGIFGRIMIQHNTSLNLLSCAESIFNTNYVPTSFLSRLFWSSLGNVYLCRVSVSCNFL